MPSKARKTAACFVAIIATLTVAGCGEDRSNLLPADTAADIDSSLERVPSLVERGRCFVALAAAEGVRDEVEALGEKVDDTLRRNLLDGVTQLQIQIQDECVQDDRVEIPPLAVEPVPEVPEAPATGSGDGTTGTTGDSGTTGDTGGGQPEPEPEPEPEPPVTPEPNPPVDNGSGGVGPSSAGGGKNG